MQSMTSPPGGVGGDVAGGDDGVGAHIDDVASSAVDWRELMGGAVGWRGMLSSVVGWGAVLSCAVGRREKLSGAVAWRVT